MNMAYVPIGMEGLLGVEFFTYVLPWLLTFAVVYGILSQVKIPQSKPPRAIIGLVLAFIVAPIISPWVTVFMGMMGSLIVIITGLLVFIVFIEIMGIKSKRPEYDSKGKATGKYADVSIFETHGTLFALIFIIIGALVFMSSGGLQALGWKVPADLIYNWPLMFFLAIIAMAIWWMTSKD